MILPSLKRQCGCGKRRRKLIYNSSNTTTSKKTMKGQHYSFSNNSISCYNSTLSYYSYSIQFIVLLSISWVITCHQHVHYDDYDNIVDAVDHYHDHHSHHDHEHHSHSSHRHLDVDIATGGATGGDNCGYEQPTPLEIYADKINMLFWSFQRNGNPDAPPINYTVPTYFHILLVNETFPLITDSNVELYMNYLTNAFIASNAPFRFPLMGITRTINATISNNCRTLQNDYRKFLKRGGPETMNIYICNSIPTGPNGGSITGFASSPGNANNNINDGVTIVRSNPTDLNRPNTLVHEVGHFLGLHHTFVDDCDTTRGGDLVDDTPYHISMASQVNCFSAPITWDTCPTLPGLDPVDNYMTYTTSNHACRTRFTPGQVDRMKAQFEIYRYVAPTTAPTFIPTRTPTLAPTTKPTLKPTKRPTFAPTRRPTVAPTKLPTKRPTIAPTKRPTVAPTKRPTSQPIKRLTDAPIQTPQVSKAPSAVLRTSSPTTAPNNSDNPDTPVGVPIPVPVSSPITPSPVTKGPSISPITKSPTTKETTTSPNSSSPVTKSPALSPNTKSPAAKSPTNSPQTTTPQSKAPVTPKCRFWLSLCNRNNECCSGRCRYFIFQRRCLL